MIIALKAYVAEQKLVSQTKIGQHFNLPDDALVPMLEHWVRKGLIKPYQPCNGCQLLCHGCHTGTMKWFQWCESA